MDRRNFLVGLAVAAAGGALATQAQAATYHYLGSREVNPLLDFDKIHVGIGEGVFNKIRLKVTGNDLLMYDLKVTYANGADDDIPVRLVIPQGGMTRIIDLNANYRFIRHVRFAYGKLLNGNGPTFVELYGLR